MPVKRQIALFANAEWVVGPHGGGFANLVFCRHGARIVEFFAPQYVNVCYWALACQLGIRYGYVLGRGPHLAAKAYPNDGGANMEVDVPKLLALLERMGMA
jgi:capsular polysaccharide biosynthesis protein